MHRALFSSSSEVWETPTELYAALDREFRFTLDPCPARDPSEAGLPLFGTDGLSVSWAHERVYCNPPYGRGIERWLMKASEAELAVYLLPARTDTRWWHSYATKASEVRFVRGRLRFGGAKASAPFPSVLLIYRRETQEVGNGGAAATSNPSGRHERKVAPPPSGLTTLLTLEEVAATLRLNPRTIRRFVASGRLPCARLAGRLRFHPADVVRFVEARRG